MGVRVECAGCGEHTRKAGAGGIWCASGGRVVAYVLCPACTDKLRRDRHVLQLIREFAESGKLVAAICHGGWIPISAGVYRGVRVTGSPGIKVDLANAGATWEDASVVVDRHFVSSRKPEDLPDFCRAILKVLLQQK